MSELVTFGEAMVRLSPPEHRRLEQATTFNAHVGGGELNVAIAVARLGLTATWVSRLPDNALGRLIRNRAREHGVDTSHLVWETDGRAGLYFCEFGAAPRASSVIYDRAGSSISLIRPGEIDWSMVLSETRWFHVTGVTPALSPGAATTVADALRAAKQAGCHTSYDLNYRAKLWSQEEARSYTEPVMQHVDTLITTEEDIKRVFDIEGGSHKDLARLLGERYGFSAVAVTLRENVSVWRNNWTAFVHTADRCYETRSYEVEIVDRVGGGDSFCAGYIYGVLTKNDQQYALDFAVALSALKHSIPGDFAVVTRDEVEDLMRGGGLRMAR